MIHFTQNDRNVFVLDANLDGLNANRWVLLTFDDGPTGEPVYYASEASNTGKYIFFVLDSVSLPLADGHWTLSAHTTNRLPATWSNLHIEWSKITDTWLNSQGFETVKLLTTTWVDVRGSQMLIEAPTSPVMTSLGVNTTVLVNPSQIRPMALTGEDINTLVSVSDRIDTTLLGPKTVNTISLGAMGASISTGSKSQTSASVSSGSNPTAVGVGTSNIVSPTSDKKTDVKSL